MKRYWIEYQDARPECPMTFWVHREVDGRSWNEAEVFDPPRQPAVPGRGYPIFKVEFDGFVFEFSSMAELYECINTLDKRHLPRTIDLTRARGTSVGPNSHWLSRLPAKVKSWKYRQKAVEYFRTALRKFEEGTV